MKIKVKNNSVDIILDIIFQKTPVDKRRIMKGKELIDTTCQICIVSETLPVSILKEELICVTARQNPLDKYNRIIGKKVALTKAIANIAFLKPMLEIGIKSDENLKRRSMRQHIWNVFHQTFGRWN